MTELWGRQFTKHSLLQRMGCLEQIAGVRLVTLGDGGGRGVRILEFSTGTGFRFDIAVDRCFDISHCDLAGRSLGWESGVGLQGPWYYEPEGFGWFRTFGAGLLTTCGLEHTMFPEEDTAAHYDWYARDTMRFGLHGRVSNRPARLTGYGSRWDGERCLLWADGEVLQAALNAEHLLLRRHIEAVVGESRLLIHDEVENVGHKVTPHMFTYHINFGFPVVDEGSELLIPASGTRPDADSYPEGYRMLDAPSSRPEQTYEHDLVPEPGGTVPIGIVNRKLGFGAYQVHRTDQFAHHGMWRMLGEGTYALSLEPTTNWSSRADARMHNELIRLQPGERRVYDLELGALDGHTELDAFAARVQALL